ncbi:Metalloprotease TldD [archaeon HR06]|nr:Metalloprotease TldD [archaeon HR06]
MQGKSLESYLEKNLSNVKYGDLLYIKKKRTELTLGGGSFEILEERDERVSCRVLDEGYAVVSTDKIDDENINLTIQRAVKQARILKSNLEMVPVETEKGEVEKKAIKEFNLEDAKRILLNLQALIKEKLGYLFGGLEIILNHTEVETKLVTTEGTNVTEKTNYIDISFYLAVRALSSGYSTKIIGGQGGLEILESRDWDSIINELIKKALDYSNAQTLPPLERGNKFKVIFDYEGSGVIAHEVAKILSGSELSKRYFSNLQIPKDLEIIDNPEIAGAYGSFVWDSEGVRGKKKVLLKEDNIDLLHTRLTAKEGDKPGNARGVTHLPRPSMSNVYIKPSDWKVKEIFEDTGEGIFVQGIRKVETNLSDGRIEFVPEIAYLISNREIKRPLRNLRIVSTIRNIIQRMDAIGSLASLKPVIEKEYFLSEGGPFVRVNNVICS